MRNELADRLAKRPELMRSLTPRQFEEFVADLYAGAGFDVELTPAQSDGGFDVYARQPAPFGSMVTLIECKQYASHRRVGVEMVRQLAGVVETEQAHAGVLATTATFTSGAQSFAERYKRIALQDYFNLQDMLMATPRR
ncbi:MAG TPA: restriction endonuclease [Gemmatimonadales bacterium]|nr:restriction endonuclease [Gemmatimonadales bacterium]